MASTSALAVNNPRADHVWPIHMYSQTHPARFVVCHSCKELRKEVTLRDPTPFYCFAWPGLYCVRV